MRLVPVEERRARLALRHHLARPAPGVEEAAAAPVGLHSSDPTSVYLSLRARVEGLHRDDVDRVLYDDRSLVRIVGMRRTLWVVPRPMVPVVHEACTKALVAPERRRTARMIEENGLTDDGATWLRRVSRKTLTTLRQRGEATGTDLAAAVPELSEKITFYKSDGSVLTTVGMVTRILFQLATEGKIVRGRPVGSWLSARYRWTPMDVWLDGEMPDAPRAAEARARLLSRWLLAFGPGTETDITWWAGWTRTAARRALADAGAVEVEVDGGPAWVAAGDDAPVTDGGRFVRFLPSLDPLTMGWKERDWYLGANERVLFDRNGNAGPTIWVDGRVVGGWAQRKSGEVVWDLLEEIPAARRREIAREAEAIADFVGDTVVSPRFRSPLHDRLRE